MSPVASFIRSFHNFQAERKIKWWPDLPLKAWSIFGGAGREASSPKNQTAEIEKIPGYRGLLE
jgi:hypothetical protein